MNNKLPSYIGFPNLALFLYATFKLKAERDYSISSNIAVHQDCTKEDEYYILHVGHGVCSCWDSDTKERAITGCHAKVHQINSVKEFNDLLEGPKVTIAGRDAKLSPVGVRVGNLFVKWEEVDALIEARKQMES